MATVFVSHPPDKLETYFGAKATQALAAIAEIRFNEAAGELPAARARRRGARLRRADRLSADGSAGSALSRSARSLRLHPLRRRHPHGRRRRRECARRPRHPGEPGIRRRGGRVGGRGDDRPRPRHRSLRRGRPRGPAARAFRRPRAARRDARRDRPRPHRRAPRRPRPRLRHARASRRRRNRSTIAAGGSAPRRSGSCSPSRTSSSAWRPLSADTDKLMNAAAFSAMRRGAFFVNAARGELVDDAALLAALDSGHLAGCALDVGRAPDQMPAPGARAPSARDRDAAHRRPDAAGDRAPGARDGRPAGVVAVEARCRSAPSMQRMPIAGGAGETDSPSENFR